MLPNSDDYAVSDPCLQRCLELARLGGSGTLPNPMVGSVIVHEGTIIGEGWHKKAGQPHAEVNAVASVKNRSLLPQSTIYVSLEPCNHYGRTPPCTQLILKHNIPRVVIGSIDPDERVSGSGVRTLREGGVEVSIAADQKPFIALNKQFFVNQKLKRPYIHLKWAQSKDGLIAAIDTQGGPRRTKISNLTSSRLVHRARGQHQAILVGANTARIDNPRLTTRLYYGPDPVRIVLDADLQLKADSQLLSDGKPTIVVNRNREAQEGTVHYFRPENPDSLSSTITELYQRAGICSILVEGGLQIHQQFLDAELYDELTIIEGMTSLETGLKAPDLPEKVDFRESRPEGDLWRHWQGWRFID